MKDGLKIIPVKHVEEVLKIALVSELKPVEWSEINSSLSIAQADTVNQNTTPTH